MSQTEAAESTVEWMDAQLESLSENKEVWAKLDISARIAVLREVAELADKAAERWVAAALQAKGIAPDSALAGEEWASGPWALLYGLDHLVRTLTAVRDGGDLLTGTKVRTRPDGQVIVRVHPADIFDTLLLNGCESEVWMAEGVTAGNLRENMAGHYRGPRPAGKVSVVLGAGNIASIAPLDVLYKLIAEGQVVVLKMNPVNDYLGPIFEEIFEPLKRKAFVAFAYGGVEVGKHLTTHPLVDEIHITGSEHSFNAIVYGSGDDAEQRREKDEPINPRPITSELGGVGPIIVVPGPWSASDLAFQAENVATMKLHNGGFNCIAAQVLILSESWPLSAPFLEAIQKTIASIEEREPYYPGALDRVKAAREKHAEFQDFGESRTLITKLSSEEDANAFTQEFFCSALAQTSLPQRDPEAFLRAAVAFANQRLHGTLGANILIHPKTQKALGSTFEDILADLNYGTIGVNGWVGLGFLMARATWGAHPGHARNDIQSGQGVVHNAMLFDKPKKTVVRAPFREFPASMLNGEMTMLPRPPWFVTNKMGHQVMRRVARFSARPAWKHVPGIFAAALRG